MILTSAQFRLTSVDLLQALNRATFTYNNNSTYNSTTNNIYKSIHHSVTVPLWKQHSTELCTLHASSTLQSPRAASCSHPLLNDQHLHPVDTQYIGEHRLELHSAGLSNHFHPNRTKFITNSHQFTRRQPTCRSTSANFEHNSFVCLMSFLEQAIINGVMHL